MAADTDDGFEVVPRLVPARMVSEYFYCPRFFHLAWSGTENADNEYTVAGKRAHRPVDTPRASTTPLDGPAADAAVDGVRTESFTLSSERLGLIARLDRVEFRDGLAVPVEYKLGRPKVGPVPVMEPERVQLAVAGMLLRDAGHRCDHGEVYFTDSRQRVVVEFDDELVSSVVRVLSELRAVARDPVPPPPLADSPKCPACVLVGICLPDEQNLLRHHAGGRERPPRRLVPHEDAARPLYVTEPGASIGRDGDRAVVRLKGETRASVRLIDVSQVSIYGNATISSQLIRELLSRGVPVCWFSSGGWFTGMAEGLPSKNVELRRRQVLVDDAAKLAIAAAMIRGKILNARTLLRRNGRGDTRRDALSELKRLSVRTGAATDEPMLLGIEGGAARIYFSKFSTMLKGSEAPTFDFTKRNRRPPADPINCLLSYVYGLLARECTTTLHAVGLDPYIGVFHRPRFGRPALALDLAEEFRPLLADSVVIGMVNNAEITDRDFVRRGGAVALEPAGRRKVLAAYERRLTSELTHPLFGYRVSYRRAIEVQARLLGAVLLGEFGQYSPVVTR